MEGFVRIVEAIFGIAGDELGRGRDKLARMTARAVLTLIAGIVLLAACWAHKSFVDDARSAYAIAAALVFIVSSFVMIFLPRNIIAIGLISLLFGVITPGVSGSEAAGDTLKATTRIVGHIFAWIAFLFMVIAYVPAPWIAAGFWPLVLIFLFAGFIAMSGNSSVDMKVVYRRMFVVVIAAFVAMLLGVTRTFVTDYAKKNPEVAARYGIRAGLDEVKQSEKLDLRRIANDDAVGEARAQATLRLIEEFQKCAVSAGSRAKFKKAQEEFYDAHCGQKATVRGMTSDEIRSMWPDLFIAEKPPAKGGSGHQAEGKLPEWVPLWAREWGPTQWLLAGGGGLALLHLVLLPLFFLVLGWFGYKKLKKSATPAATAAVATTITKKGEKSSSSTSGRLLAVIVLGVLAGAGWVYWPEVKSAGQAVADFPHTLAMRDAVAITPDLFTEADACRWTVGTGNTRIVFGEKYLPNTQGGVREIGASSFVREGSIQLRIRPYGAFCSSADSADDLVLGGACNEAPQEGAGRYLCEGTWVGDGKTGQFTYLRYPTGGTIYLSWADAATGKYIQDGVTIPLLKKRKG